MNIRMSNLDFFCNRPTLVALIEFGIDLGTVKSALSSTNEMNSPNQISIEGREKAEENEHDFVKGLLGYGKGRAIFYLNMNVDSVCVYLSKEDGSQLAMLVQERFQLDLKVRRTIEFCFSILSIFFSFTS